MEERGKIIKQLNGDLYQCLMEDGRRYDIEIIGYAGGDTDLAFILFREAETIEIESVGSYGVVIQTEY